LADKEAFVEVKEGLSPLTVLAGRVNMHYRSATTAPSQSSRDLEILAVS
jgi:hypothetical protein